MVDLLSGAAAWTAAIGLPNWPVPFPREVVAPGVGNVHRLVVRRDHAGAGLGAELVEWAARRTRAAGRTCLRLDCSADNLPLCSYYERLGFAYRGEREGELTEPGGDRRWKTRLYERDCHEETRT